MIYNENQIKKLWSKLEPAILSELNLNANKENIEIIKQRLREKYIIPLRFNNVTSRIKMDILFNNLFSQDKCYHCNIRCNYYHTKLYNKQKHEISEKALDRIENECIGADKLYQTNCPKCIDFLNEYYSDIAGNYKTKSAKKQKKKKKHKSQKREKRQKRQKRQKRKKMS